MFGLTMEEAFRNLEQFYKNIPKEKKEISEETKERFIKTFNEISGIDLEIICHNRIELEIKNGKITNFYY